MRSVASRESFSVREHTVDDLTKRARILDAAIYEFAGHGKTASVRAIAARAGVSPGLITHHFGSKAVLRKECDDEVLRRYVELKMGGVADPLASVGQIFDDSGAMSTMVCYMIRSFLDGGDIARRFMDHLIDNTRDIISASLDKGLIKPSRDEEARIRYLVESSIGAAIVRFVLDPPTDITETFNSHRHDFETMLAQVEVMTEGVFADRTILDAIEARATQREENHV